MNRFMEVKKMENKTIDEIYKEATNKERHLWIQSGLFEDGKAYVDRNGKKFTVTEL